MYGFSQLIENWQTFYATIAGATATLLGLLFVAVSLNRAHLDLEENAHLMSLARQTFSTYLFILTFSIVMLIPKQTPAGLGIPLTCIGIYGLFHVIREMVFHVRRIRFMVSLRRYGWSLLAFILMVTSSLHVLVHGDSDSLYHMVSSMFMLLVSATKSTWVLLVEIRSAGD
jgi:hypothetical protein